MPTKVSNAFPKYDTVTVKDVLWTSRRRFSQHQLMLLLQMSEKIEVLENFKYLFYTKKFNLDTKNTVWTTPFQTFVSESPKNKLDFKTLLKKLSGHKECSLDETYPKYCSHGKNKFFHEFLL